MEEQRSIPASARVLRGLREQIVDGSRPEGSKLVEREIAAEFGVSRLPVREAIRQLIAEGVVARQPRHGGVVRRLSPLDLADISEILEALDRFAVRQAALRRSAEDVVAFARDVEACAEPSVRADGQMVSGAVNALRDHVYWSTRNVPLLEVHAAMRSRALKLARATGADAAPLPYFHQLTSALEREDPDAAEAAIVGMYQQIRSTRASRVLSEFDTAVSWQASTEVAMLPGGPAPQDGEYSPEFEEIRDRLRRQICAEDRLPGSVLSEREIAAEFEVSRLPVRQAIEALALEGLVVLGAARSPARVRGLATGESADLLDLCVALDILATRLAAQRASGEDIQTLAQVVEAERKASIGRESDLFELMFEFRERMYIMSKNPVLLDVDRLLGSRLRMVVRHFPIRDTMLRAHHYLFEAVAGRETYLAESIYRGLFANPRNRQEILSPAHGRVSPRS